MSKEITLEEARNLVDTFNSKYYEACDQIRSAARAGKEGVNIEKMSVADSTRLERAGFCITMKSTGIAWVFWG